MNRAGSRFVPLLLTVLLATAISGGVLRAARGSQEVLQLSTELRLVVHFGRQLELQVLAREDADYRTIADRFAGGRTAALAAWNGDRRPDPGGWVRVPFELLSADYRGLVLRGLFPKDRWEGDDWVHVARAGVLPTYDEGMWQLALWFTGRGSDFQAIMTANGLDSPEVRKGQVVRIPRTLLHDAFRPRRRSDDGALEYGTDNEGPFAAYRLREGEALYSAVVVRFTGRTGAEDVASITEVLTRRSRIRDARDIPVNYEVRIPLSLLEPEYLPSNHPRRIDAEQRRRELEEALARRPVVPPGRGLQKVMVIVDPGHGGRDLGTSKHGVWEHDYVYDVACRLREKLEQQTSATVFMTLEDVETGCRPSTTDELVANRQGTIRTNPPFIAREDGEAQIGVNLRWYLANSVYRAALADGFDADRVVFLSLHADSRHPSLSGVMVYVPGADYRTKTYGRNSGVYRRYEQVREKPHVKFSHKERVRSEAISRELANAIVDGFRREELPVQPYQPVRDKVIRGRSKWVPAVLRGNQIPTKVLVEMVNLGNREDARLLSSALARESLAEALLTAIHRHFGEDPSRIAGQTPARQKP